MSPGCLIAFLYDPRNAHPTPFFTALSEGGPHALNAWVRLTPLRDPPVAWDLRDDTSRIQIRELKRPVTGYDLTHFVTEPPLPFMRLYHPRLPWYIDVIAQDPVGTTLYDLFSTIHAVMRSRISKSDYYNNDVTEEERNKVARAWRERCQYDQHAMSRGVTKVDFLMRDCIFLGLAKGREGMWEIKTRKI